jgi:hypothetical protein
VEFLVVVQVVNFRRFLAGAVYVRYSFYMSTKELLRKFKAMTTDQQQKFLREAHAPEHRVGRASRPARKVAWPDVELRAKQITGSRILPNLILVDRDDAAF